MKAIIATALISASLFTAPAFAGASNTIVKCQSADGKVALEGDVPGDFAEFSLSGKFGSGPMGVLEIYSRTNQSTGKTEGDGHVGVVEELEEGVFTIDAKDSEGMKSIQLYALPKTVKLKKAGSTRLSSFVGKLSISSENGGVDRVTVKCTTDKSI